MALLEELKKIKHIYGEEFMKICRASFPTILENEGVLLDILKENFANNSRTLAQDLQTQERVEDFKKFVVEKYHKKVGVEENNLTAIETPEELLKIAGYDLYEAKNFDELMKFKRYYAKGEELCSFAEDRTASCMCFWAVKKDADMLMRSRFLNPEREDEYSTSVLAIQFDKFGACSVSIKSRYNHTVDNPDATYKNDLDKIAPGLANSFKRLLEERGYEFIPYNEKMFCIEGYTKGADEKFYKYNIRACGAAFCPGNVVLDQVNGEIINVGDPEQQVLIDNYVLDLKAKTLKKFEHGDLEYVDSFADDFKNIEKIDRTKNKETGETTFTIYMKDKTPVTIVANDFNQIVEYKNENVKNIGDGFMKFNKSLHKLELPNVEKIGTQFLERNRRLKDISLPNVKAIGDCCLDSNYEVEKVDMPKLEMVGGGFLEANETLTELCLPSLKRAGANFLLRNESLTKIDTPNLEVADMGFLAFNRSMKELELPNLRYAGVDFMGYNNKMENLTLPKLEVAENGFMKRNQSIKVFSAPNLKEVPKNFFRDNKAFKKYEPNTELVNGIEFARLDRASRITDREIGRVGRAIDWFRRTTRNIINRDQDQDER